MTSTWLSVDSAGTKTAKAITLPAGSCYGAAGRNCNSWRKLWLPRARKNVGKLKDRRAGFRWTILAVKGGFVREPPVVTKQLISLRNQAPRGFGRPDPSIVSGRAFSFH